jgi:hypothetical protein
MANIPELEGAVWFSEVDLRVAAGPRAFARGQDLVSSVVEVRHTDDGVRAVVDGTASYEVFLGPASPGLFGECPCPAADFCQHCVAVGLAVLGSTPVDSGAELPQITALRRRLDAVLWARTPVDHAGSLDYAGAAGEFLDTVAALIDGGHAAEARPLARRAVERIAESLVTMADTSGVVTQAGQRALTLYARACTAARPNGPKLAAWLFQLELNSPGRPTVTLPEFADALGDAGLAAYRTLVDEAWAVRADGDIRQALALLVIRERLAKLDGAPVEAPLPEDLPNPAAFLGVASAEHTSWLAEFLVHAYLEGGRASDALELRRSQLTTQPTRDQYAKLRETALDLGRWAELRSWALDVLRSAPDELVGALIDDGDPESAWESAEKYGCSSGPWLEVARIRVRQHPADVLPGYRGLVHECLQRTGRGVYREAVSLLLESREASEKSGQAGEFLEFVAVLRERHRRRSALLDEFDKAGLGSAITPAGPLRSVHR